MKLKELPFTNTDTSVKESILILDRNHKDKVNVLPINLKISLFMIFLDPNFTIERDLKKVIIGYPSLGFQLGISKVSGFLKKEVSSVK